MAVVDLDALPRCDVVYLSPHLDDAALSCTGAMAADRRCGRRVLVATLFTEGSPGHAARRAEDEAALTLLGVDGVWAGLIDAPFRSDRYRSFAGITLDADPADAPLEATAADWLARVLEASHARRLVAPLGVGGHVDHRLAFGIAAGARVDGLQFYEDRPYALIRGMVERRLGHSGLGHRLRLAADFPRAGYVRSYAGLGDVFRAARLRRRQEPEVDAPAARWRSDLVIEAEGTSVLARQVAACYHSQWPELFGSLETLDRATRRYSAHLGFRASHAERLWRRR